MAALQPIESADIAIVGAGPTGLALANLLGGMGVTIAVIERNPSTVQEPRAVSIDDESMRTLQAIGLARSVETIVARGYGSRYLSPRHKAFLSVEPTSRDYGFDKRNAFQQPELEALLRRGLERYPNITDMFGWEMESFTQDGNGVVVKVHDAAGASRTLGTRYMVACDGARSLTRGKIGVKLEGSTFAERWLIVDLVRTENRLRHTEVFCDPARPCISLPGPNGIRRYEFMLHRHEDDIAATDEAFVRNLLASVGPDRDCTFRRVRVYAFHARLAKRWREGRVFLAGDAAHLTPPFAGQGMNSGLRDAHNLAWKLAEAVRGHIPDEFLDSYEVERKPHAGEMIALALRMARIMMPENSVKAFLIRSAFSALDLYPPARDYFAQMRYKPKPRFRNGLMWGDGKSEKTTMVGRLLPQPIVEDVQMHRCLLDDILPDRPVVLVFDEFPDRAMDADTVSILRAAGAEVVGITPEWMNPGDGVFSVYRDVSRLFSAPQMKRYLGHSLLLRRDRYVAAAVATATARTLCEKIAALSASRAETSASRPIAIAS